MEVLLSYIIPVYNVEQYIEECVDSVLRQNERDIEVVLVDDGSTDKSGSLCDKLTEQYDKVRTIHKRNMGPSAARNDGLDAANGIYVTFVDSDDRIAEGTVNAILEWIRRGGADLCFMGAVKLYEDGTTEPLGDEIRQNEVRDADKLQAMHCLSLKPKFPGSACTKIFRKAFLEGNGIRFPNDRRMHEDLYFVMQCIEKAATYDALEMPYYIYRQGREGSRSQSPSERSYQDLIRFVKEMTDHYTRDKKPVNREAAYLMASVAYEYSLLVWKYCLLPERLKKETLLFLKTYRWIMRFSHNRRIAAIRTVSGMLGIPATSRILDYYMKRGSR